MLYITMYVVYASGMCMFYTCMHLCIDQCYECSGTQGSSGRQLRGPAEGPLEQEGGRRRLLPFRVQADHRDIRLPVRRISAARLPGIYVCVYTCMYVSAARLPGIYVCVYTCVLALELLLYVWSV